MNPTLELLMKRKEQLETYRNEAVKRLKKLNYKGEPKFHVRIDTKKDQIFVVNSENRKQGKYISLDNVRKAEQIATYDYLNAFIKRIDKEITLINTTIHKLGASPEDYYTSLTNARQNLIKPIIPTDAQFVENWISQPYEPKPFDENDDTDFRTFKDERVRSKSEILIANALERKQIPYKYECPILLKELGIIHPDFTALNVKKRKIIYWEHLGKMDDPDYARKNTFRINIYQKHGIYLGDSLIVTMETSTLPLDVKLVDELIKHYLLE